MVEKQFKKGAKVGCIFTSPLSLRFVASFTTLPSYSHVFDKTWSYSFQICRIITRHSQVSSFLSDGTPTVYWIYITYSRFKLWGKTQEFQAYLLLVLLLSLNTQYCSRCCGSTMKLRFLQDSLTWWEFLLTRLPLDWWIGIRHYLISYHDMFSSFFF